MDDLSSIHQISASQVNNEVSNNAPLPTNCELRRLKGNS